MREKYANVTEKWRRKDRLVEKTKEGENESKRDSEVSACSSIGSQFKV